MSVETVSLIEVQNDVRILRLALEALQTKISLLLSRQQEAVTETRPMCLTDLEGIWGGVDLSYEEIKAAEYKIPEDVIRET